MARSAIVPERPPPRRMRTFCSAARSGGRRLLVEVPQARLAGLGARGEFVRHGCPALVLFGRVDERLALLLVAPEILLQVLVAADARLGVRGKLPRGAPTRRRLRWSRCAEPSARAARDRGSRTECSCATRSCAPPASACHRHPESCRARRAAACSRSNETALRGADVWPRRRRAGRSSARRRPRTTRRAPCRRPRSRRPPRRSRRPHSSALPPRRSACPRLR